MEIVAALFVEGIDFRQVDGPSTRIDITGAFFSTAVEAYPARDDAAPRRARASRPPGSDGQRHARDRVRARGRRRGRPQPPAVLRRAGQVRVPPRARASSSSPSRARSRRAARSSRAVPRSRCRSPRSARVTGGDRDRTQVPSPSASKPGVMDLVNRYAAALSLHPTRRRGGRRGRGRDPRAVRRRAPRPRSCASRRRTTSARSRTSPAGSRKLLEPDVLIGCTAVAVAGGAREVEDGPGALGVRGALRRGPRRRASRSTRCRPTTAS